MTNGYSMKDAAKKIGVHHMTLYRWEKANKIPLPKRLMRTNARIYTEEDIAAIKEWMEQIVDPAQIAAQ
jgi:excisionase family DNA binding protein